MSQSSVLILQDYLDPDTGQYVGVHKESPAIAPWCYRHFFKFYAFKGNSLDEPVELDTGTLVIEASDGQLFGTIHNGFIDFSKQYDRPSVMGALDRVRLTANGLGYTDPITKRTSHDITLRIYICSYC